jgi:agmatinase
MINKKQNISTFIGCEAQYEEAEVVLFGIPFDGTTSFRPGTRFAMQAIRPDSYGLETYSPYSKRDLENVKIFDGGDLEIPLGNTEQVMDTILSYTREVVADGKKFMMVGGEHLVSYPTIQAMAEKHPDLHIIHFDAHTDLRDTYNEQKLSHATVLRRAHDLLGDGRIFQFGIRSGTEEEFKWAETHITQELFTCHNLRRVVEQLKDKPVYITIDLDVLDPSIFPGTGTPEPGGWTYRELLDALSQFEKLNHIVAADVVELSPQYDLSGGSTAVACKTIRELLLLLTK